MVETRVRNMALVVAASLALSGCGGFKNALGLSKYAPDEFAVVSKAPLIIPPEFNLLPPKPGAARPMEAAPRDRAFQAIFPNAQITDLPSPGERALLRASKAQTADPNIRLEVASETDVVRKGTYTKEILYGTPLPEKDNPTIVPGKSKPVPGVE